MKVCICDSFKDNTARYIAYFVDLILICEPLAGREREP
jgi:hypothetical protein